MHSEDSDSKFQDSRYISRDWLGCAYEKSKFSKNQVGKPIKKLLILYFLVLEVQPIQD